MEGSMVVKAYERQTRYVTRFSKTRHNGAIQFPQYSGFSTNSVIPHKNIFYIKQ